MRQYMGRWRLTPVTIGEEAKTGKGESVDGEGIGEGEGVGFGVREDMAAP